MKFFNNRKSQFVQANGNKVNGYHYSPAQYGNDGIQYLYNAESEKAQSNGWYDEWGFYHTFKG